MALLRGALHVALPGRRRTAADIVEEFELIRLDEYFDWSRRLPEPPAGRSRSGGGARPKPLTTLPPSVQSPAGLGFLEA